jgi:hypothetical protein
VTSLELWCIKEASKQILIQTKRLGKKNEDLEDFNNLF